MNIYMIYGLAGAAWTKISSNYTDPMFGNAPSADDTVSGWTAGAGVEGVLTNSINWRLEYRYADYKRANVTCPVCGPTYVELDTNTVSAGISMHW